MVGKLIKYDFQSFFRLLFPVQLIVIGIAGLNRIVQIFENETSTCKTVFISSIVLLVIACVVALVMSYVIGIVRFYQGLYSSEGYLSHSLPVTSTQHIWSKLIVSMLFECGTLLAIFIAANVATLGEVGSEVYKAGGYLAKELFAQVHFNGVLFLIEWILIFLVAMASSLLMMYFCISIGQLVNRKKILLAFGVLFGLYILGQILATILIILGPTLVNIGVIRTVLQDLFDWAAEHRIAAIHIASLLTLFAQSVLAFVYFLVTERIMTKRLNLS